MAVTRDLSYLLGVHFTAARSAGIATRTLRSAIAVGGVAAGNFAQVVEESSAEPAAAALDGAGNIFYTARVSEGLATFRHAGAGAAGTMVATNLVAAVPSPDGTFVIGIRPNVGLVRANADGSDARVLLEDVSALPIAITHDSSMLVYQSNREGHQQPWRLALASGAAERLANLYINESAAMAVARRASRSFSTPAGRGSAHSRASRLPDGEGHRRSVLRPTARRCSPSLRGPREHRRAAHRRPRTNTADALHRRRSRLQSVSGSIRIAITRYAGVGCRHGQGVEVRCCRERARGSHRQWGDERPCSPDLRLLQWNSPPPAAGDEYSDQLGIHPNFRPRPKSRSVRPVARRSMTGSIKASPLGSLPSVELPARCRRHR